MWITFFAKEAIDIYKRVLPVYRGRKSDNDFKKSLVTSLEINDAIILRA